MATKAIDYLEKMVTIAHYEHEGFEYDALHLSVMHRKGVGFFVSYQPVKRNGFGGFETGPLPSDDPLVGGKTLLAENADKNNAKRLQQMMANLEAGTEAVVWLFDHREWDKLNIAIVRLVRDGYTEKYRQQMHDLMAETGGLEKKGESPMMRQFNDLKAKHPDSLLLFRRGDFYECYCEDAVAASKILGIVLTGNKEGYDVAGFPHHALASYLPKLIRAGKRVAICDQLPEPPKPTVKRGETECETNNENLKSQISNLKIQKNTTMAQNVKAADLIGKVIIVGNNQGTIVIKSVQDNGMLACEFKKAGDTATTPLTVTMPNLQKMTERGLWKMNLSPNPSPKGEGEESRGQVRDSMQNQATCPPDSCPPDSDVATEADVAEVDDIMPKVTKRDNLTPSPSPKGEGSGQKKAVTMPLGSHGTLVIAGVGGTKKTAVPAVQTDLQSGCGECKDLKSDERIANANTHGGAIANHAEREVQDSVPQVRLVVYTTKHGDQAPRIEGFGGETDPRWKRHYDEKVRLAEEKKKADAFNEKLQEKMKGKKKDERDKLRKQWKSVGSDPFGASYFTDRTTGEKHYQMILGAKYMDAAQQLTDAYNSGDADAIAAAEQAVVDVKNGIVSDYKAQKAARAAEREAERKAKREAEKSVDSGSAATEPSFTLDQVAAMLGRLLPEGVASTEDIKKLLQAA